MAFQRLPPGVPQAATADMADDVRATRALCAGLYRVGTELTDETLVRIASIVLAWPEVPGGRSAPPGAPDE